MEKPKWDFQIERPVEENGLWRIGYTLTLDGVAQPGGPIAIETTYRSAHTAIDEATRLARIHAADLNGEAPTFEKPTEAEVPFGEHQRF
ncbi:MULTISPECIES: hypothetical protein [Achromobacter]|uniref:DUF2188 domain-containing protein n=2 Tax=Achromobacter piechaudii TaxID=72556 RepID=A0ABN7F8A1_9BURK|nr:MULTISPECIES: hypothetical protein [Achromobacter]EFF73274.1 hypothetical protein HMPREF0004_5343 [Achromobacter piechaudii ATCC 43553]KNY09639.1 hypothetical protein AKG08_14445 [Achromobacter piechaudii]MPS78516.1 hypothetical protein [Achromobacter sp.]CAB3731756.1 hypothetical protein LMG1873_04851 [Achromobacter piechaudii]CAB3909945.1 hypothetical protein LMG2828_04940 [Achromobacter piechaudii]